MFDLPEKILLENFNGDWQMFENAVYEAFCKDFVNSKPFFRGKKLNLKKNPFIEGKEYTFYHMVSAGKIEDQRIPDIRRYERIKWAKPTIEKCDTWNLKVWPQKRNGKNRICIWIEIVDESDYIVILDIREDYILPWTTFILNYNHEKIKKLKEYNEYLKSKSRSN
jgi:hypothetical protein